MSNCFPYLTLLLLKIMFYDGNDKEIPIEYVNDEFDNYYPFKEAARMIDLGWTSQYLHKQKNTGRIKKERILYVISESMKELYPSTGGKKMFLHLDEINRFKAEELPKIKRQKRGDWTKFCRYCRAKIEECLATPCQSRVDTLIFERAKQQNSRNEVNRLSSLSELDIQLVSNTRLKNAKKRRR